MGGENARKYSRLQPGAEDDQRRIEVRVETDDDGRRQVVLEDLSYGPGIGWYVQKTIRLDPEQVDALMGSLCCAKQESRRQRKFSGNKISTNTAERILQLADFIDSTAD